MNRHLQALSGLALILAAAIAPKPATALGPGSFDSVFMPTGLTCNFNVFHDFGTQETQVNLSVGGPLSPSAGGNYWLGGVITSWAPGDIQVSSLQSACGLSNVTNFVSDGANGTYATDDFVGVRFRGTALSDGLTYDYVIGASGVSATSLLNTRVQVVNTAPTADAGPDQSVGSATAVTLDGTGSADNDVGQTLTYLWSQIGGPDVTLSDPTASSPTFTAPTVLAGAPDATLVFSLVVNDGVVDSAADNVSITVAAPANTAPTADAGPDQSVGSATAVTLDGTGSADNDVGQTLTYLWSQISGPDVTLSDPTASSPTFTAPTVLAGAPDATLVFSLVVNDGVADSAVDSVSIIVTAPANAAPTADAGPDQSVASGGPVTLTGAASDANNVGRTLTYAWAQTGGPSVSLAGATSVNPSFTAPTLGRGAADVTLVFRLVVNDGITNSAADTVSITVRAPAATTPTANAGPDQRVVSGASVTLTGAASDANNAGRSLTYAWAQTSGPSVSLAGATSVNPSFTAPTLGQGAADATLVFSLVVNDGVRNSAADSVTITVTPPTNTPPVGNAGAPQTVESGSVVALDGSGSDAGDPGQTLSYAWSQTGGPAVTLSDATVVAPSFAAPTLALADPDVVLTFSLIVNDGIVDAPAATVQITVTAPANTAPTADAGPDQSVAANAAVTLDGSVSNANDPGQTLTYSWTQTSGLAVKLADATSRNPGFTAPALSLNGADEVLTFSLIVNDGSADSAPDTVMITVAAPVDVTSPTVTLSGAPTSFVPGTPFSVTITFSEPVTGLAAGDIIVTNGMISGLSGAGATYAAEITSSALAPIEISIPAGVAVDAADNPNLASAVITIAPNSTGIAQEAIVDALTVRAQALIGAQPNLRSFFGGSGISGLSANINSSRGQFRLGVDGDRDSRFWMLLQGTWSEGGTTELDYYNLAIGSHLYRSDTTIVGAMLQLDRADATLDAGQFEGQGWLVGPYLVARLPDHPLVFSASLLHGETDNTLTLDGQAPDDFSSTRTLFTAGVEGRYALDDRLTLIPSLDLAHVTDRQEAYRDSLANTVPKQTIRLTEASFGLGFEQSMQLDNADLLLTGGISGIYSELDAPEASSDNFRGRVDLGAEIMIGARTTLSMVVPREMV